jgi:hypothetical protein
MYYQTLHENKLVGGYISRHPKTSLITLSKIKNELEKDNRDTVSTILSEINVTYVVIYNDYLKDAHKWYKITHLNELKERYDDSLHIVFLKKNVIRIILNYNLEENS